jgi:NADH-quinone oxidoreductase subunit J
MISDYVLFFGLAIVAVVSALGVLFSKSAIYSALNLILNFLSVAAFFLLLEAPFLALLQITVYAGAIMVLFLFVIMLLGAVQLRSEHTLTWQQPLAIGLGLILMAEVVYLLATQAGLSANTSAVPEGFGSPQAVGLTLYTSYLLPFEVTSILLLVAIVGAIVLTHQVKKKE